MSRGDEWLSIQRDEVSSGDLARDLADLLVGSPHNLVSARASRAEVVDGHIAEAQRLGEWMGELAGEWMDLGTGGGLPGLILAHMHTGAQWTLVDATGKKAREVDRFARILGIDCQVVVGRAEDLAWEGSWREGFDGVVTRGLAPMRILVELARGFVGEGGCVVAVKGDSVSEEIVAAERALAKTGMEVESIAELSAGSRVVTLRAMGPAPEGVPRRAGVPRRRPW